MDPFSAIGIAASLIFNQDGLKTLRSSTDHCSGVFDDLRKALAKASKQIAEKRSFSSRIELSKSEKAKWPFHQPRALSLRSELTTVKSNLVILLSIAHLAHSENWRSDMKTRSSRPTSATCSSIPSNG